MMRFTLSVLVAAAALGLLVWRGAVSYARPGPAKTWFAEGFRYVGYHDFGGRPAFKLAIQRTGESWHLYASHFWDSGWSVLDVSDPSKPELLGFTPGPDNTATLQIQVAGGRMLTSMERPPTELLRYASWRTLAWLVADSMVNGPAFVPWRHTPGGVSIWDVAEPARPRLIGSWASGGTGTHRNFYAGGRYAHLAANRKGFRGHQYVIVDLDDPVAPVEAAHWFLPEQELSSNVQPTRQGYYLHGPAHVVGDRAYLPYGVGGAIIMDISDVHRPREVGRWQPQEELGSEQGVHSFVPVPERRIAIVNSEAHDERCLPDPGRTYAAVLDIADETRPRPLSFFPEPVPPPGAGYSSFCERGGRSGPHNQHHDNGLEHLYHSDRYVYIAHFSAGLRLYDTSDPRHVREVGYFLPPDPQQRYGPFPTELVVQTEDVIVDARGYAYVSDKNQGVHIVKSDLL